jgi:hypothetical protein
MRSILPSVGQKNRRLQSASINLSRRKKRIGPKVRVSKPEGQYHFDYRGEHYVLDGRFIQDSTSPDGLRWVASKEAARTIRALVCEIADKQCEMRLNAQCWKWAPSWVGHPHHFKHKKMGGASADDRIWVNGERIRIWACPGCHQEHHGPLAWSKKGVV